MRSRPVALFIFGGLASLAVMAGAAWACSANLTLDPVAPVAPDTVRAGATVTIKATGGSGATEVQVLWDRIADHHVLATVAPGTISVEVVIPADASPGLHMVQVQGVDSDGMALGADNHTITVEAGPPVGSTDPTPDPTLPSPDPIGGDTGDAPTVTAPTPDPTPNPTPSPAPNPGAPGAPAGPVGPAPSVPFIPADSGTGATVQPSNGIDVPVAATPTGLSAPSVGPVDRGADTRVADQPPGGPPGGAAPASGASGGPSPRDAATSNGFTVGSSGTPSAAAAPVSGSSSVRSVSGDLWSGFVADSGQAPHRPAPSRATGGSATTDHGAMALGIALLSVGLVGLLTGAALVRTRRRQALATGSRSH